MRSSCSETRHPISLSPSPSTHPPPSSPSGPPFFLFLQAAPILILILCSPLPYTYPPTTNTSSRNALASQQADLRPRSARPVSSATRPPIGPGLARRVRQPPSANVVCSHPHPTARRFSQIIRREDQTFQGLLAQASTLR